MASKMSKKFKARFILKGCHQVAPDDWVTHHMTIDATVILEREFNEDDFVDELAGVEIVGALDEEVKHVE